MGVNPVVQEIIRGSLRSTIQEMELLMERCAMSPFIKEKKDYFVGIYDTRSRIVCCHISSSGPGMVAPILAAYPLEDMRPGDVYWFNDPYISKGAVQHHQDMVFATPVFDAGEVVAFAVTYGHYQDIGGMKAGSIVQPRFPAPLGMRAHTRFRVVACLFGTLAQANGGQVPANSPVYVLYYFRAQHPNTHQPILCIEGLGVGLGARPFADGIDAIYYIAQENYPVEYVEKDFPLRIEQYAMRPDSGGPGLFRGGCGIIRDVRVLCDKAELGTRMENTKFPPYGVAGGRAGRPGKILLYPGTAEEREIPQIGDGVQLRRGDLLRLMTCGGGGWGDPFSRDPMLVQQDVARGFVSVQGALEDYGVVLDPLGLEIDKMATEEHRRHRPHSPSLFDRGPTFAQGEAEWYVKRSRA